MTRRPTDHIVLSSHPNAQRRGPFYEVRWGAPTAAERGPVIASLTNVAQRNAIGTHAGAYAVYRALAVASGALQRDHRPDLTDTAPAELVGPHPQWSDPDKIVSMDPWGHLVASAFAEQIAAGADVRPTMAITKAHINMPELKAAIAAGRLVPDGNILSASGDVRVTKAAIGDADVQRLEQAIDRLEATLPPLRRFILPGGSAAGALLHLARTVCRRAERRVIGLGAGAVDPTLIVYLNRLSDLLFVMARAVNHRAGAPETEW